MNIIQLAAHESAQSVTTILFSFSFPLLIGYQVGSGAIRKWAQGGKLDMTLHPIYEIVTGKDHTFY